MRRALIWGAVALALAVAIWVIDAESFWRPLLAVAPVVIYAVVVLVRVLMEPARGRAEAVAPALRGLVEGQGLSLGRPQPAPVAHGTDEEPAPAHVVDRADALDALTDPRPATN